MPGSPKFPADKPRGYSAIELAAAQTRREMGFGPDEPVSAFESMCRLRCLAMRIDDKVIPICYGTAQLQPQEEAETRFDRDHGRLEIILNESTYAGLDGPEHEDPRARFSFFHELGHATLHGAELVRISVIPKAKAEAFMRANFKGIAAYRDVEWQANAYAGAKMMPAVALKQLETLGRLTIPDICRRFHVSREAAAVRLSVFYKYRRDLRV